MTRDIDPTVRWLTIVVASLFSLPFIAACLALWRWIGPDLLIDHLDFGTVAVIGLVALFITAMIGSVGFALVSAIHAGLYAFIPPYLLRRKLRRAEREAKLLAMAKAAEDERIADELAAAQTARAYLTSVLDHARVRAHADREAWRNLARTELHELPVQPAGNVFELYARASSYHRLLIREGYQQLMELAHPRHDVHIPIAIATLPPTARLLYLPVAIDATDGPSSYDWLDFELSDHKAHRYVYRSNRKVPDIEHWRNQLPAIEAYLGGRCHLARGTGSNIVLTRLPDIAPAFPLEPAMLKPGHAYLGQDLHTGAPVHLAFDKLSHTLVAGPTGLGKSVALHTLMASVVTNLDRFETVHLVDLKYGLELQDYASLHPKFRLTSAPAEVGPLLTSLIAEMDRRGREMQQARKQNWDGPLILVVIDEFADVLLSEPDKKKRDALETALIRLTNLSRALGFRFWLQSQKTTADALPTPIRTNLQSILSFRMATNQAAAGLFGIAEGLPANIMLLNPGQAIYRDGRTSETVALQGPLVTFADVAALAPSM